ncbi:MAG: hypothetical protein JXR75_08345 [Rhodobacteraceae bacterium]|nr:hypothetical protein [Paracoccaceae bacterium]
MPRTPTRDTLGIPSDLTGNDGKIISDSQMHDGCQLVSGWWVLPSVIGGAAFWVWAIRAVFF